MIFYFQNTGELTRGGKLIDTGYSGFGEGKNNPSMEQIHNTGPIPCGLWEISQEPFDSPEHGPFCLRLTPCDGTNTYGRDGFLIHGDSLTHPGSASKGCICASRAARQEVHDSKEKLLSVV